MTATTTYTAGQTVRDEQTGLLHTVLGYDDRGLLDVIRSQDGLRVILAPRKVYAVRG